MSDTPDPLLDAIARISEGQPVDWEALDRLAVTESFRQRLGELKVIAGVADLARKTPSGGGKRDSAGTTPTETIGEGVSWGHLKILEQIGRGAFGEVYRAWDTKLDREVALKLIHAPSDEGDSRHTPTIEEGRLLARVRHPNVVTVYGADRIGESTGIWMEFLRGRTLEQILRASGPLEPEEVVATGIDLSRALTAVHAVGLLHRDVKAPNVVREDDGRLVLMDFGSVVEHDVGTGSDGSLAGTPLYLAPEVLGGGQPTVLSDIYAVGVLLYHLATGEFPVRGTTFDEVREATLAGAVVPIARVRPGLPAGLVKVIERAMAHDPAERYTSAATLETALQRLVPRRSQARWPFALGGAIVVAAAALAAAWLGGVAPFASVRRTMTAVQLKSDAALWGPLTGDGRRQGCLDYSTMNVAVCDLVGGSVTPVNGDRRTEAPRESSALQYVISPSGRRIAYGWVVERPAVSAESRGRSSRAELRIADTSSGSSLTVLGGGEAFDADAWATDWTRDESQLLVTVGNRGSYTIELLDITSGDRRVLQSLTQSPGHTARMSPDGRFVTYAAPPAGSTRTDIFILEVATSVARPLIVHPDDDTFPVWRPAGDAIAFASDRDGQWGIWRVALDNGAVAGEPERLYQTGRDAVRPLGFRGDDTLVYWLGSGGLDVYTAALDLPARSVGPAVRVARTPLAASAAPAWSPDGQRLAYIASRSQSGTSQERHVIVQDAATGNLLMEVRSPGQGGVNQQFLEWTPDGTSLLVRAAGGLHVIEAVTGRTSATMPNPFVLDLYTRSPDGTRILGVSEDRTTTPRSRFAVELDPATGRVTRLGRLDMPTSGVSTSLVISPDGRYIGWSHAVGSITAGPFDHSLVPVDGGSRTFVTTTPVRCRIEAWIGDTLVLPCYLSPQHDRFDWRAAFFTIPVSGGLLRELGLELPQLIQVRIHPSGDRIAFTAGEDNNEIWALENLPPIRRR